MDDGSSETSENPIEKIKKSGTDKFAQMRAEADANNPYKRAEQLLEQAETDPLTKLPNRRGQENQFERSFNTLLRPVYEKEGITNIGVIFFDLDNFKLLNDTFGHDKGDEQLRLVSETLKQVTRGANILARMGGEEFCVIVINEDLKDVVNTAQRIAERYQINQEGKEINGKTISIGISMTPKGMSFKDAKLAWQELKNEKTGEIKTADDAAYNSKTEKEKRLGSGDQQISNISIYDHELGRSFLLKDYDVEANKPKPEALV